MNFRKNNISTRLIIIYKVTLHYMRLADESMVTIYKMTLQYMRLGDEGTVTIYKVTLHYMRLGDETVTWFDMDWT